jgi:hypothetical protein
MRLPVLRSILAAAGILVFSAPLVAQGGTANSRLRGFDEVPALSTPAGGRFSATINEAGTELTYQLEYFNLEGAVTQAHIHLGQKGVNGGIVVFFCSNLGNGPAGTQACPPSPATVTGTIHASDVTGASAQGLGAGELFAVLRAIRAGVAYANVHTTLFPGGEARGQILFTPAE